MTSRCGFSRILRILGQEFLSWLKWLKDLAWLWVWCRLAPVAPIRPLAWERSYAAVQPLKSKKKKKKKERKKKIFRTEQVKWGPNFFPVGLLRATVTAVTKRGRGAFAKLWWSRKTFGSFQYPCPGAANTHPHSQKSRSCGLGERRLSWDGASTVPKPEGPGETGTSWPPRKCLCRGTSDRGCLRRNRGADPRAHWRRQSGGSHLAKEGGNKRRALK